MKKNRLAVTLMKMISLIKKKFLKLFHKLNFKEKKLKTKFKFLKIQRKK